MTQAVSQVSPMPPIITPSDNANNTTDTGFKDALNDSLQKEQQKLEQANKPQNQDTKKIDDKKLEEKRIEEKKIEDRKAEEKKTEEKKLDDKKAEDKIAEKNEASKDNKDQEEQKQDKDKKVLEANPITAKSKKQDLKNLKNEDPLKQALKAKDVELAQDLKLANSKDKLKDMLEDAKKTKDSKKDLEKSLEDIKQDANAKKLDLKNIDLTKDKKEDDKLKSLDKSKKEDNLDATKKNLKDDLELKGSASKNQLLQNTDAALKELNDKKDILNKLLSSVNTTDNEIRQKENAKEKIDLKVDNGDKVAVILRGASLPSNVVSSKIRNDEKEKKMLEQIKDIVGDLDLDTILEGQKVTASIKQVSITQNINDDAKMQGLYQEWLKNEALDPKKDENASFQKFLDSLKTDVPKDKESKKVESKESTESKDTISTNATLKQEVVVKNAMAKEAIKNFASQFKEELQNYKPPITKLNIELNPASLGEVTMSITKKGKDLQVNITSNSNVMGMFLQNQQDLRNNLMQVGFNNLDLNFNQKENKKQEKQEDKKDDLDKKDKIDNVLKAEDIASIDVIIPEYA